MSLPPDDMSTFTISVTDGEILPVLLDVISSGRFNSLSFKGILFGMLGHGNGQSVIETLFVTASVSRHLYDELNDFQRFLGSTHQRIVRLLANTEGECDFYDSMKLTTLHYACRYGWLGIVESLLREGADPNSIGVDGTTPLLEATEFEFRDIAHLLVFSGADVFCCRRFNYTLLHSAVRAGWFDFVEFLLEKGLDPNAIADRGRTPLYIAVSRSRIDIIALLMDHGAHTALGSYRGSLLHYAVDVNNLEVVKFLVEKGADVNDRRCAGFTPLAKACRLMKLEVIEYLVNATNIINGSNDTPLMFIMREYPNGNLIKMLVERYGYLPKFIDDYYGGERDHPLNMDIFQDVEACTEAIVTKFNNKDLPALYNLPLPAGILLPIQNLMIASPDIIQDIRRSVESEIIANKHCDLRRPKVIVLQMLSVTSYLNYYNGLTRNYN